MIVDCAVRVGADVFRVPAPGTYAMVQDVLAIEGADQTEAVTGFLTDTGRFLARDEASVYALAIGQAIRVSTPPYLSWSDLVR